MTFKIHATKKILKSILEFDISEDMFFKILKLSVIVFLPLFFLSMLVVPWLLHDWKYLQKVWHSWQGFNVGMLAFLSTSIIFLYTHTKNEAQRKRDLTASLAFLPSALASVSGYLKSCVPVLEEAYERVLSADSNKLKIRLDNEPPELPQTFQSAFKECIRQAEDIEGELMSEVLRKLQIQNSRLQSLYNDEICENSKTRIDELVIKGHFDDVIYLKALIDILYPYARGGDIESATINRRIAGSAFSALNFDIKYEDALREFMDDIYNGKSYELIPFKRKGG